MFWVGAACGLSIMLLIAASGSGTINTIAKWTAATALGDSQIVDDGTNVQVVANGLLGLSSVGALNISGGEVQLDSGTGFVDVHATLNVQGQLTVGNEVIVGGDIYPSVEGESIGTDAAPFLNGFFSGAVAVGDGVTFSSGSSAPVNAVTPAAWVTVRIGANEYRVPLYQ